MPYAGASSYAYFKWVKYFGEKFEPCFVEMAGRGMRSQEGFYQSIEEASLDLSEKIQEKIGDSDYIIFGHSMGALIAFETYYKLMERQMHPPLHMYFSGKDAPHLFFKRDHIYEYEDEKFLSMVSLYGALPEQIYDDELRRIFVPILRADFKILCQYTYIEKEEKIRCDISILYSDRDFSIKHSKIDAWEYHAGRKCSIYQFLGDHFYIDENGEEIIKLMTPVKMLFQ